MGNSIQGVRLFDIEKYSKDKFIDAGTLEKRIESYPQFYFGNKESKSHLNFVIEAPTVNEDGEYSTVIGSVVETAQGKTIDGTSRGDSSKEKFDTADMDNAYSIHINTLSFNPEDGKINFKLEEKTIVNMEDTKFKLTVGLKNRRLILDDENNPSLRIVLPIGVGALDLGVSSPDQFGLMTPLYENQNIDTDTNQVSWAHRNDKTYYKNKPFIRFRTDNPQYGGWSTIGFHIQQNKVFKRGFDSHGCMRLRENDLDALYRVIMNTTNDHGLVAASILLKLRDDELDHPMPKNDTAVKVVENYGTEQHPKKGKDKLGLTATTARKLKVGELQTIWDKIEQDILARK